MKLAFERTVAEAMMARFPAWQPCAEQLKLTHRAELPVDALDPEQLDALIAAYHTRNDALRLALLDALRPAFDASACGFAAHELEAFLPALLTLLAAGERGWLYQLDGGASLKPWVVSRIDFNPGSSEERARLAIDLKANSCARLAGAQLLISERDLDGSSVSRVLARKGYVLETPALRAASDASLARYHDWRSQYSAQFRGQGLGIVAEDPTATHRNTDFSRKSVVVLSASEQPARLVNDEAILPTRDQTLALPGDVLAALLKRAERNGLFDRDTEQALERWRDNLPPTLFTQVPIHPFVLMYHLELHCHLWVHVDSLTPYVYQPELKHKLVLPETQVDLIDILTAEMDVLMDDVVEGKSGGTTVLCTGPAGVGKTLTAEVYAEIIGRPLYRVHSGQLGLDVGDMERTLREALIRAQRWGAVMLIDEADVYIRRRDDQLATNAVVGVFLRVLEYFNGLLFLTTNRMDDIDEAIISRCIAMIRYSPPSRDERLRIWQVMAAQFGLALDAGELAALAERFATATGRDIKGLAKLAAKYCRHKQVSPSMAVFERCAMFRGMGG